MFNNLITTSESCHKGSNTPSIRTQESWMENGRGHVIGWVSALCFLQCFDTVGWVTGRTSGYLSPNKLMNMTERNWLAQIHLDNGWKQTR